MSFGPDTVDMYYIQCSKCETGFYFSGGDTLTECPGCGHDTLVYQERVQIPYDSICVVESYVDDEDEEIEE